MFPAILSIFAALLPHLTDIVSSGETMFNDIAHGEGGVAKVQKVSNDLAALSAKAAGVAATVQAATAAANGGTAAVLAPAPAPLTADEQAQLASLQARAAATAA